MVMRLDSRHVRKHALRAVAQRLNSPASQAVLAVTRDGDSVLVRLNSGGNALAVQAELTRRGYRVQPAPADGQLGSGLLVRSQQH